ncbi:Transposable element Tc3 transposase [Caligus rogercresseyi]|uniref:Transposable element Tc3 transposase n=1 Tax=Caligus rogercresseyi TaxID=217165 RepID=A0A7T8KJY0_CALRO|nr:Transposable element Tc3 transposase [Caligus rogercresseyi]
MSACWRSFSFHELTNWTKGIFGFSRMEQRLTFKGIDGCACQLPEKPTRLEGQHQRRNCQYTR